MCQKQYFTDNDATIHTVQGFRIVFFPWRVLLVLAVGGGLIASLVGQIINPNAGYVVFSTMIGHYMVYETFHFCCHVPENWFVQHAVGEHDPSAPCRARQHGHIKDKLKPVIARFRTSETQNARCTLDGPKLEQDELTTIRQVVSHA